MGAWVAAAFVKTENQARLRAGISVLMAEDGYAETTAFSAGASTQEAAGSSEAADTENENRGVAIVAGGAGWAIVRTMPFTWLCLPAPGQAQPRLVHLAYGLNMTAVYVEVQDGESLYLLECRHDLLTHHVYGSRAYDEDDLVAKIVMSATTSDEGPPAEIDLAKMLEKVAGLVSGNYVRSRLIEELAGLNSIGGTCYDSAQWVSERLTSSPQDALEDWWTLERRIGAQPPDGSRQLIYYERSETAGIGSD